jgi:dihydrofolate reductase
MPKYIAIAAVTLDGKIAKNKDHMSDWTSPEDKVFMRALLDKSDVIIVGNNTYKTAIVPLSKRNCIVLSRSADKLISKSANLIYCKPKKSELLKILKTKNYKLITILGGAQTYSFCLKNNLLDELYLTIEPLVFGEGINLFDGPIPLLSKEGLGEVIKYPKFNLLSTKKLNKQGSLLLHYKKI